MARRILLVLALPFLATSAFSQNCKQPASSNDEYLARGNQEIAQRFSRELNTPINNLTFSRDTTVFDRKGKVKAFCNTEVVFDDQGNEVVIVRASKGKLKYRTELKDGEAWAQKIYGFRKHVTSVEVKEVSEFPVTSYISKGAPEITLSSWARGATVRVTIEGFTPDEQAAIRRGVESWNVGFVNFTFEGEGLPLLVKRGDVRKDLGLTDRDPLAYFNPWTDGVDVISGELVLDYRLTRLDAIQSVVAHEMGHGFGLSDCTKCKSVMKATVGVNKSTGYLGPSSVDLEALRPRE